MTRWQPWGVAAGAVLFLVVATLNAGGYRYGAADQAFYIPAILKQLDPGLYPRDTALIGPQARYFLVDEVVASAIRTTGWSIETWFAVGYIATLLIFFLSLWRLGHIVYGSSLAVWTLLVVETLRHRITRTGVNTLEGYFHPRVLVFAVGVGAIAFYLRGRIWLALGAVIAAGVLHPTTAGFFLVFLGAAIWTTEPDLRRYLGTALVISLIVAAWLLLAGPLRGELEPMNADWRAVLASKDYLFPTRDWSAATWVANMGTAALAIGLFAYRVQSGVGAPREKGIVAGACVLTAAFLITLPAVASGSALLVQLQISRVFWLLDLLAVVGLVGLVMDERVGAPARASRWRPAVLVMLVVAALARGLWVTYVEHAGRPPVQWGLPADDWTRTLDWIGSTAPRAHFLADPGHAWRYGTPLRNAGRDVFLEETKDTAMAIYARASAERVLERIQVLEDFDSLDEARATAIARQFRVDYLVVERDLALPLVHQEGRFRIYRLR